MGKVRKIVGSKLGHLRKSLEIATNEKDVENAYRQAFSEFFPAKTSSPFRTDGTIRCLELTSLLEFKSDVDLKLKLEQSIVLVQTLWYLKKMEKAGVILPKSIFIGDKNECLCLPASSLIPHLIRNGIDLSVPASKAASIFPEFVKRLAEDSSITPFVYNINEKFSFDMVVNQLIAFQKDEAHHIQIAKENIEVIFEYFRDHVVTDNILKTAKKGTDVRGKIQLLADVFFNCLTDKIETYLHPSRKNVLVTKGKNVSVNSNLYIAFFAHFKKDYTPSELEGLVANKDRIIEEVYRRMTGAFFTPTLWVNEAHKMIGDALGKNWRDEYVIWDCAAGTANLTRDYTFKELYISSLEQGDIDTINDMEYNKGAAIFQYDFLGELGLDGVPENLKKAFADGKKILFFINPPYGTANNLEQGTHKAGIAKNVVNTAMLENGMGKSSQQLYAQFLFRIVELQKANKNVAIAFYSKPSFIGSPSFGGFRELWFDSMQFQNGMLFQASHFADVSSQWGVSFTTWKTGKQENTEIVLAVKDIAEDSFEIVKTDDKKVYAPDSPASGWVREGVKGIKTQDAPQISSYVTVKQSGRGKLISGAIGYLTNVANNVYKNSQGVFITSSCSSMAHGLSVLPNNFRKVVALFTARKSIKGNWINDKDEYCKPTDEVLASPEYVQWNNDAIIYAFFNNSSHQSSLRDVQYRGKIWQIHNNFFFVSNAEMKQLADTHSFNGMYQDSKAYPKDSYVYNLLQTTPFSDDARQVMEAAKDLIRKSMPLRELFHQAHPDKHLQSWDAGWSQMKPLLKEHFKEDYAAFVSLYKKFEDRMRIGVYEFGFLA